MHSSWKEAPFIRLIIPLVLGILLYEQHSRVSLAVLAFTLIGSFIWLIIYGQTSLPGRYQFRHFASLPLNLLLISFGYLLTSLHDLRNDSRFFENHYRPDDFVMIRLLDPPEQKTNSFKCTGDLFAIVRQARCHQVQGKLHIYFSKGVSVADLRRGTTIITKTTVRQLPASSNPGAFDYKQYSARQNIHHQLFLGKQDFTITGQGNRLLFEDLLDRWRSFIVTILRKYIHPEQSAGLAEALLIGYKKDLDSSLTEAYTNTGVVHIIAISGMHLGLIYFLLLKVTQLLRIKNALTRTVIILTCLWIFSLLTGASASVLRSAVMFSFLAVGALMKRQASPINSLFASAFLLLSFFPTMLYDVGFQLSYAAVFSLIVLMKPVYDLLYLRNPLLDEIWKLAAGTLAAQVFTLPLILYHFHQFPVYVVLANLVAVPLSTIILFVGIAICLAAFISPLSTILGQLCSLLISWMNSFVLEIGALPFASIQRIFFDLPAAICLYLCIASIVLFLFKPTVRRLEIGLGAVLLCISYHACAFLYHRQTTRFIVYNLQGSLAASFISSHSSAVFVDSTIHKNKKTFRNAIEPSLLPYRAPPLIKRLPTSRNLLIRFAGKRILVLNNPLHHSSKSADIILPAASLQLDQQLIENIPSSSVVVVQRRISKKLEQIVREKRLHLHVLSEKGAFVINLN